MCAAVQESDESYALHSLGIRGEPTIVLPVKIDADRGGRWAAECEGVRYVRRIAAAAV